MGTSGILRALSRVLGAVALVFVQAAAAQAVPVVLGDVPSINLSPSLEFLEDRSAAMTLGDVRSAAASRFQPAGQSGVTTNFGLTGSAIWLRARLAVPAGAPRAWLLEVAYPPLDRVELYVPDAQGNHVRTVAGDTLERGPGVSRHRSHVMRLNLPAGEEHVIFLRAQSQGPVSVPVKLWQPEALWASDQATYSVLNLYFGLLVGLLSYNLLLYLSVRDKVFLLYVAFVAALGVAQAALTGLGAQFVWGYGSWWTNVAPNVGNSAAAVFGIQFARSFLDSRAQMPRLDRTAEVLAWCWLASLGAALLLPYTAATWMTTVLSPLSVAGLIAAGIQGVRLRQPGSGFFLGAWAALLAGVMALFLHNIGVLPSTLVTANSLLIGSALEMVLLSFALGDRINAVRREKDQAQARHEADAALVKALSESQERYRTVLEEREIVLDNSLVGIAFLSPEGRFRWANRAMLELFGVSGEARDLTTIEPYYLSRAQYLDVGRQVADSIRRGETFSVEVEMRRVDGVQFWAALTGKAVSLRDLSQGTVWAIMDITHRKTLEATLERTSSEREAILNSALVGMVLSVKRRLEWVNEGFALMLGYQREELLGQTSMHLHTSEAEWEDFGKTVRGPLRETGRYTCERELRRKDGTLLWVEMAGNCIQERNPDGGVIWAFIDITARKRSEQEIRGALEQQRALNELRSRFVAMTSHEYRTPLAGILSAGELLREYGERLPPEERAQLLESIVAAVHRMSRMVDRVLLLGRADAQMLEFAPRALDLVPLCRKFVDEAWAQHPDATCQVVTEFDPALRRGEYDEKLLRHIFGNLLSNALKYSPSGGRVRFSVRAEPGSTVFEVSDEGIGIPESEVPHLFGSFHRASNVGGIQGTGLGLAIVKNAVDKHGGTIEVHSREGEGTRFVVRLPVAQAKGSA